MGQFLLPIPDMTPADSTWAGTQGACATHAVRRLSAASLIIVNIGADHRITDFTKREFPFRNVNSKEKVMKTCGVTLMALLFVGAAANGALGEIIAFTNPDGPDHFDWAQSLDGSVNFNTGLDITASAADQSIFANPAHSSFQLYYEPSDGSGFMSTSAVDGNEILTDFSTFALPLQEGELAADSGGIWTQGFALTTQPGFGEINLADGESGYLMVKFVVFGEPGNFHHGWIGVTRDGITLDAFAWGYETEANTAIAAGAGIPAPGALALLGLAGLASRRRRR
jgi:MYXO-CTERM domain-containing protein